MNLSLMQFLLISVTANIQNVLLWLEGRHGDACAAGNVFGNVNNALFHSNPHVNQMLHQIIHVLHFCLVAVDSLLNYVADFVVNLIEARAVWPPQIWKFIG